MASTQASGRLVPAPGEAVPEWHVSPWIDVAAYHLSWLWILIPLLIVGGEKPADYLLLWTIGITVSFVHRHYTMPYVYLDAQVFNQHPARFSLLASLLAVGFVAMAYTWRWKIPVGFLLPVDGALVAAALALFAQAFVVDRAGHSVDVPTRLVVLAPYVLALVLGISGWLTGAHAPNACIVLVGFTVSSLWLAWRTRTRVFALGLAALVAAIAIFGVVTVVAGAQPLNTTEFRGSVLLGPLVTIAAVWNVWHTLMQKYGILRVYSAKSRAPVEKRTPGWVDRFLIFSWFPLLALVVGHDQREVVLKQGAVIKLYLTALLDGIDLVRPFLLLPAIGVVVAALALFIKHERATGVISKPRITMALALTALHASFLVANPVKVYIAYGFSHAVEYMVFVWAFQRRRYATELPHRPLMGRILRRPLVWYASYSVVIAATYFFLEFGDDWHLRAGKLDIFGVAASTWIFSFAIWHSIAHFWYDGFLWKMRLPAVRASL